MKTMSLRGIQISDKVLKLVSPTQARFLSVLPFQMAGDTLRVMVLPDADAFEIAERLENTTGLRIELFTSSTPEELRTAIRRCYSEVVSGEEGTASGMLRMILNRALQLCASDIHIAPGRVQCSIKMRIDGELRAEQMVTLEQSEELISVIKIASGLDISEKRTAQDGALRYSISDDEEISLRVATIPTLFGEHVTLRLLTQDHDERLETLNTLGFSELHKKMFYEALAEPNGMIILSGPTGSGKTTTLYAALRNLRCDGKKHLVSIEDPVEKPLEGVSQIRIDADGGRLSFAKALRSILRHDPDVIMIGEIRDGETGDIAMKSALTGHLVLSTLHTNGAAGIIPRLTDLGIAPYLTASTLRLAVAQRLVRIPCAHCVKKRRPTAKECVVFGWDSDDLSLLVPEIHGCSFCGESGYIGRMGIYEMIPADRTIGQMIHAGCSEAEFDNYAFHESGLPSMLADGAEKILQGMTSVEEVCAVVGKGVR